MRLRQTIRHYRLYHLPFWILAGLVWYYLRYQDYTSAGQAAAVTAIKIADLALMVYLAAYLLVPRLLYRRRYGWFVLSFIALVATSSLTKMYLLGSLTHQPVVWTNIKLRIYEQVIPHFFLVIAGVSLKLVVDHARMQNRLSQIAREKAEAELSFLKSQINPHFLFNSLNAVYFLIDKNNHPARQALHKLADLLRYQLYEVGDEKIAIEKEVGYLQDYIGLQQLRNDNCRVAMQVDSRMESFSIEPLLLVPLVENSFKHLSHFGNGKPNEIRIDLSRQNGEMNFLISNTTEAVPATSLAPPGGIGLSNIQRRLELLYPNRHQLNIHRRDGWFDVHLKLKIESA